jgi:hypothetical protein
MAKSNCDNCPIRAKYDANPKSLIGRFWRWHINFCPGWKGYMKPLNDSTSNHLKSLYYAKQLYQNPF